MEIFRSLEAVPPLPRDTALAIGNFDGLHLGHQKILRVLVREARVRDLLSCVLTFSPHPEKIFGPEKISMIQTLEQRLDDLSLRGVEMTLVLPFTRALAELPARDFVLKILVKTLRARAIVVGSDFRFGKNRRGDIAVLEKYAARHGFLVRVVPPVKRKSGVVSSSRIRELLGLGRIEEANALLGAPYSIEGDVVGGETRGRRLGFPTANVETPNEILPRGVFISLIEVEAENYPSITNVGSRPTFQALPGLKHGAENPVRVETHILGFRRAIYGASVRILFLKKIRDEQSFPNAEALAARIARDRLVALAHFRARR